MIIAKGTVIVNGKEYGRGQAVEGLSGTDVKWMKRRGFDKADTNKEKPTKEGAGKK